MRVDVLRFGVLKDLQGGEPELVELGDGARVGDLLRLLEARGQRDETVWKTLAVAVNREYAGLETVLSDGDEVALLPPVSGGGFLACASAESMSQERDRGHPKFSLESGTWASEVLVGRLHCALNF